MSMSRMSGDDIIADFLFLYPDEKYNYGYQHFLRNLVEADPALARAFATEGLSKRVGMYKHIEGLHEESLEPILSLGEKATGMTDEMMELFSEIDAGTYKEPDVPETTIEEHLVGAAREKMLDPTYAASVRAREATKAQAKDIERAHDTLEMQNLEKTVDPAAFAAPDVYDGDSWDGDDDDIYGDGPPEPETVVEPAPPLPPTAIEMQNLKPGMAPEPGSYGSKIDALNELVTGKKVYYETPYEAAPDAGVEMSDMTVPKVPKLPPPPGDSKIRPGDGL